MTHRTSLPCPACADPLSIADDQAAVEFFCPRRHVYSLDALGAERTPALEESLRQALQASEAKIETLSRIVNDNRRDGRIELADQFESDLHRLLQRTQILRNYLAG
jgi:hypothetical protein